MVVLLGTEWHNLVEWPVRGMRLEEIRQKLVRAMELFPQVIFGKNLHFFQQCRKSLLKSWKKLVTKRASVL
jgi:hypothetical protein